MSTEPNYPKITTDLERQLVGAVAGFKALFANNEQAYEKVLQAAIVDPEFIDAQIKPGGGANDRFNVTMWNLCNDAIGKPMESEEAILRKMRDSPGPDKRQGRRPNFRL